MDDPWRELGLEPGASEPETRAAYRKLVRRYPPELAPERFARIQDAYDTLRSPSRLLSEAWERPAAVVDRLYRAPALALAPEPAPPPAPSVEDFEPLLALARRLAVETLLREARRR